MEEKEPNYRKCPDGGKCHHNCREDECFRVACCEPLSGVYPDGKWPTDIRALGENFRTRCKQMSAGLFAKYKIEKRDGSPVDPKAVYFVLRLDTDPIARAATIHYSELTGDVALADGLRKMVAEHERPNDPHLLDRSGFQKGYRQGRWESYMDIIGEVSKRAGQVLSNDELTKPVQENLHDLAEKAKKASDIVLANTIIPEGPNKGRRYKEVYGDPPYEKPTGPTVPPTDWSANKELDDAKEEEMVERLRPKMLRSDDCIWRGMGMAKIDGKLLGVCLKCDEWREFHFTGGIPYCYACGLVMGMTQATPAYPTVSDKEPIRTDQTCKGCKRHGQPVHLVEGQFWCVDGKDCKEFQ